MKTQVIEIDGKRYFNTLAYSHLWKVSQSTVAKYCRDGKVPGAFQNDSKKWWMPSDAMKPPSDNQIQEILLVTLQLKNDAQYNIDYDAIGVEGNHISAVYTYLAKIGYFRKFSPNIDPYRLPYEVKLTKAGMDFVTSKKPVDSNIQELIQAWGPTILSLAVGIVPYIVT